MAFQDFAKHHKTVSKTTFWSFQQSCSKYLTTPWIMPWRLEDLQTGNPSGNVKRLENLGKNTFWSHWDPISGGGKYKKPIKTVSKTRFWATWRILWIQFQGGGKYKNSCKHRRKLQIRGGERCHPEIQFQGGKYKNTIKPVENERNEHFWVTNLAFEGGGSPGGLGGGDLPPPGLYIYVLKDLRISLRI